MSRCGGMADATDSKSVIRKGVRVRVSPPALRGCREMTALKEGGVTHDESLLPKFLHKKRWLTTTIFLRYML